MNKLLKVLKKAFFILILVSADINLHAQPGMPPGHGQNGDQGAGGFAPIGEGIVILLASAVAYGIRKIRRKKNES